MSRAICRNPRRAAARNNSSHQSFETFISSGKACVTELANVEGEKLTTISARLETLHDVRLVKRRREAKHIYDSLSDAHILRFVESAMDHAAERRKPPVSRERKGKETMTTCTEKHHRNHSHMHGPNCGHTAVRHDDHVDYLHDGHLHHPHEDHVDEHAIAVNAINPVHCTPQTACSHKHGPACGHEAVPHGDHIDYLVNGRLHHPHGDHCDDHGPVQLA